MYYNYNEIIINKTLAKEENELFLILKNIESISSTNIYKEKYMKIKNDFHKYQSEWFCSRVEEELIKRWY